MPDVTSGRVVFARTVQPAQYESKKAEVELAFVLRDGEDHEQAAREVGEAARRACLELVSAPDPHDPPARRRFRGRE